LSEAGFRRLLPVAARHVVRSEALGSRSAPAGASASRVTGDC
jgi:hypothetical protein